MSIYRKKRKVELFDIIVSIGLVFFSLLVIYPFWYVLMTSFSNQMEANKLGMKLWLKEWDLSSYMYILQDSKVLYAYGNSIFRTVLGTVMALVVIMFCAYPLSKRDIPGRTFLTLFFLITMFFKGGLIPTYLLIKNLNLIDSRWVLIFPNLMNVYYMIIMRNYLMSIDNALEESAFIDGAGYGTILTKIVVPLAKPAIATVVLWVAVWHWNSWFDAYIYIQDEKKIVLQTLLRRMIDYASQEGTSLEQFSLEQNNRVVSTSVRAATTMVTIGPIIALYPFLQKYFVKGIMVGSLKG